MTFLRRRFASGAGFVVGLGLVLTCRTASPVPGAVAPPQDALEQGIAQYRSGNYAAAEASAYLAASLAKQRKYADAEGPARSALQANATHEVAVAALGESLVGQKKFDDAVAAMGAAIDKKGDLAYAYFWRGQAYDNKKQTAKIAADCKEFLRLMPKAPEAATVQAILAACASTSEGLARGSRR